MHRRFRRSLTVLSAVIFFCLAAINAAAGAETAVDLELILAVDVSGDGANNMGKPVEAARDQVLAQGIVINGLPLMLSPRLYYWTGGAGLEDYYRDCVIGGPGAFVIPVTKKPHLALAIRRKLVLEIAAPRARIQYAAAPAPRAKVDCFIGEKIRQSREYE